MSKDWKGQRVSIMVIRGAEQHLFHRYLDTDTLADIMDTYSPADGWFISILPHEERMHA